MLTTKEDTQEFNSTFQDVIQDLTENEELQDLQVVNNHLVRVLRYNVPNGKHTRAFALIATYRNFGTELTKEDIRLCYIMGWCVEMLQASAIIADDMMDGSATRRGVSCWYQVNDIGLSAINDVLMLENAIYQLLKKHFGNKDYYVRVVDFFHDMVFKTTFGQSLDTNISSRKDLSGYTMDLYFSIAKYKTSYYTIVGPVIIAMIMAGVTDVELLKEVKSVTLKIGLLFQVQDDFLDCFGNVEVTGKIGTDIQDCKCTWLFVIAMQNATAAQKEILKDNYGKNNNETINNVKKIYNELDLKEKYQLYTQQTYNNISTQIEQMPIGLPKTLFKTILDQIHGRKK